MVDALGPYALNTIITGDARELAKAIPDESVDLVLTDPVYWQIEDYVWLSELCSRILKPGGNLIAYYGNYYLPQTVAALSTALTYRWQLIERMLNSQNTVWKYRMNSQVKPALWYSKGEPNLDASEYKCDFQTKVSEGNITNHKWSKGQSTVIGWMLKFSLPGAVVVDPFVGGGTTPAVCKLLGRHYLAFEIDPTTAKNARARLAATPEPLPGMYVPAQQQQQLSFMEAQ